MTKLNSWQGEALKAQQLRHCNHCGQNKPLDAFGTAPYCKECWNAYMRKRNADAKRVAADRPEREVPSARDKVRRDLALRLRGEGYTALAAHHVLSQFTPKALDMGTRLWPAVLARAREAGTR